MVMSESNPTTHDRMAVTLTVGELKALVQEIVAAELEARLEQVLVRHSAQSPAKRDPGIQETAEELGIHPRTVRQMIYDGRLEAVRLGGRGSKVLVKRRSIDALLARAR